jgi:hypothetical protein
MGEHHKSTASRNKQNAARDARIIAQAACPRCHAPAGEPCQNPATQRAGRQPDRPHNERKAEWVRTRPQ